MRQSLVGDAETCLKRAQFKIEGRAGQQYGEARGRGTGFHAGVEMYYDDRKVGLHADDIDVTRYYTEAVRAFDAEVAEAGDEWVWEEGREAILDSLRRMLNTYFLEKCYWPADYRVWATEWEFETDWIPGWTAKGALDLVLVDPNGWFVLVDHKTAKRAWPEGKHQPRKNTQAPWYIHWFKQLVEGGERAQFVFDIMTTGGPRSEPKFDRRVSHVTPAHVQGVLAKATEYAQILQLVDQGIQLPANPTSTLCSPKYCDFWDVCPHGAALDQSL
jgi:hypothetical protein